MMTTMKTMGTIMAERNPMARQSHWVFTISCYIICYAGTESGFKFKPAFLADLIILYVCHLLAGYNVLKLHFCKAIRFDFNEFF